MLFSDVIRFTQREESSRRNKHDCHPHHSLVEFNRGSATSTEPPASEQPGIYLQYPGHIPVCCLSKFCYKQSECGLHERWLLFKAVFCLSSFELQLLLFLDLPPTYDQVVVEKAQQEQSLATFDQQGIQLKVNQHR